MQIKSLITGRRLVSLPFTDVCEPFIGSFEEAEELLENIISYCKKNNLDSIEFRSSETKFPFETEHFRTDLRHILKLDRSEKELFKSFSENTRRNIKKAQKENVIVKLRNDEEGIRVFYKMQCDTRRKHGLPPQPYKFFFNFLKTIAYSGMCDILLAKHNGNFVAGAIYLKIGKKILYKFGASFLKYQHLRGNHIVMWEAIRKYIQEGFEEFDFGKTETENEGLRRFKLGFNTDEFFIYNTTFKVVTNDFLPVKSKTVGFHNIILKNLPVSVLKVISKTLYKHVG